jgi:hypothetical protein
MNTIDNVRWLELNRYQRRRLTRGIIAGLAIALAMWAGTIAAVVLT